MMEMHANWILPRAVTFAVDAVMRWMLPPGGNVCVLQLAREGLRKKLANTTQIKGMFVGLVPAYVRECQASRYVAHFHHHTTWSQQLNKFITEPISHGCFLFWSRNSNTEPDCFLHPSPPPLLVSCQLEDWLVQASFKMKVTLKLKTMSNDCQVWLFVGCNKQEIEMTTSKYEQLNILSDTLTGSTWLTALSANCAK